MSHVRALARVTGLSLAVGLFGLGLAWLVFIAWPPLQEVGTAAAALSAFGAFAPVAFGASGLLVAAVPGRRRLLIGACVAGLVASLIATSHYWPHPPPPPNGQRFGVLVLNVNFGKADASQLWTRITEAQPDVVVLLEVQQPLLRDLDSRGAQQAYPFRVGNAPAGFDVNGFESDEGTLVLAKTPLSQLERLPTSNGQYVVTVSAPGRGFTLLAARPRNVLLGLDTWLADYRALTDAAVRHSGRPLVVAGDFNATAESSPFRRLLATGLADAATVSGAGWLPTYPSEGLMPPLLPIDHVLVGGGVGAVGVRSFAVQGTDHLGLLADLTSPA